MSHPADLRNFANWYRSIGKSNRRNSLDDFADQIEALRAELQVARLERASLLKRAAHEAWVRAKAGGSPEEVAAAVLQLRSLTD